MKMKVLPLIVYLLFILLCTGCSTFIPEDDVDRLTAKYQSGNYILLQDIQRNGVALSKGTVVKLTVSVGDEWIKIYAYDMKEELLSSSRQLLIYMFEDDFPHEKFKEELLDSELARVVKLIDNATDSAKLDSKKSVKGTKKVKK